MTNLTRGSGGAATPPKGWQETLELQRRTEYHLEQARNARHRLYQVLEELRQDRLFGRH
jgi:hypothetical protein